MNAEAYIKSGILELYVAGVLPPEEMEAVRRQAMHNPAIAEEIDHLEEVFMAYSGLQSPKLSEAWDTGLWERLENTPLVEEPRVEEKEISKSWKLEVGSWKKKKPPMPEERQEERRPETPSPPSIPSFMQLPSFTYYAIAAVVLLVASIIVNIYFFSHQRNTGQEMADLKNENTLMKEQAEAAKSQAGAALDRLAIYDSPDYKMTLLKGMSKAPTAKAMVFWNTKDKRVYIKVVNLPVPPSGMQYQLWGIDAQGRPQDAGMLPAQALQRGLAPMRKVETATAFAVTLEPHGGSSTPSENSIYMQGE